jgi:hypothetical protein
MTTLELIEELSIAAQQHGDLEVIALVDEGQPVNVVRVGSYGKNDGVYTILE